MPAKVESIGEVVRILLAGNFDFSTQAILARVFDQALSIDSAKEIQVDMTDAIFIDSSVIRALLRLQDTARANGKSMTIWNCNEHISEIFIIGGFDQMFVLRSRTA